MEDFIFVVFFIVIASWILLLAYWFKYWPLGKFNPLDKVIVITGCDSGFGYILAKILDQLGCFVFAGCLNANGEGAITLKEATSDRLTVVQMDVTKDEEVNEAVTFIKNQLKTKKQGIWALVNNAGISYTGAVEWCSMDTYKQIAEVNFFGAVRVTKAFLPLIRQSKGRIVNVTSGFGRQNEPLWSCYCASKHAFEAFSQCLRHEMKPWGVKVIIVEPGNFMAATTVMSTDKIKENAQNMWSQMSTEVRNDYGKDTFDRIVKRMMSFSRSGLHDPSPVIGCLIAALFTKRPRVRYLPKAKKELLQTFITTQLPQEIGDYIYVSF